MPPRRCARPRSPRGSGRVRRPDRSAARGGPPGGGPGPPIPRRSRRARRARPRAPATRAATIWRRSVDLPIPGSPPSRTTEPGTRPPPRTRSSSPIPTGRRGASGTADAREGSRPTAVVPARSRASVHARRAWARGRPSRRGCSTSRRCGTALPSAGTRRHTCRRRSGSRSVPCQRPGAGAPTIRPPRPASAARRRGCPGRPRGPCRPRSSCPVRSVRGAGAPRARPRPCSGSRGGAVARHRPRRSPA